MKSILALMFLVATQSTPPNRLSLPFWDASGARFMTNTYSATLRESNPGTSPILVVVATRNSALPSFKKQSAAFSRLAGSVESMQLLYAVAASDTPVKSGYWLDQEAAQSLLGDETFRVVILGPHGDICRSSRTPLSSLSIRRSVAKCRRDAL